MAYLAIKAKPSLSKRTMWCLPATLLVALRWFLCGRESYLLGVSGLVTLLVDCQVQMIYQSAYKHSMMKRVVGLLSCA